MALTSLYLAPTAPDAAPDRATVLNVLDVLRIKGPILDDGTFEAGDGFSRHVIFAGCSPHLVMTPPDDGNRQFCHVALHGPFGEPRLVTGPNTVKPRCPKCRARLSDWRDRLAAWQSGSPAHCLACNRDWPVTALDWRAQAAAGRVLIELRNVFPGEASPSDTLMQALEKESSMPWRYAWAAYFDLACTV